MSKMKKVLAALISATMLFGMTSGVFAAVSTDVANTKYEEPATVLGALNIMVGDKDTGKFRPEDNLKRSEFAKIAVNTLGLESVALASNFKTKFPDVAADHWANGFINVAVNQGLIVGDENGNFRPDDTISYAEAVTVLVRMLGYEPSALSKGSWPTGHLVTGAQIGITKGVSATNNAAITRGMVAQMSYNSLTIDLMEQTGYGSDVNYEVVDKTILEDKLDVQEVEGQVTATADTRLSGNSSLMDDEVQIGTEIYKTGNTDMSQMLGFNVTAYVEENDATGDMEIKTAFIEKTKNSYLSMDAENVDEFIPGSRSTLKYWVDKDNDTNTKSIYVAGNATMIFNGKSIAFDQALLTPAAGEITLLDTNRDDEYDIVFVASYENYVVEETSSISHSIIDKYGKATLILDPDDQDLRFALSKAGKAIALEDLKEWDVISVRKSLDGKLIKADVIQNSISGVVTESDGEKLIIENKEYEIAANYPNTIEITEEGTFYLDVQGKIAAVDTTGSMSNNYAYLVDAALNGSFSSEVEFKLFTKTGETVVLTGAEKIKLNDDMAVDAEQVLATLNAGGAITPELITFEKNSDGKISTIKTAVDKTATGAYNRGVFTQNVEADDVVYKSVSKKLGNVKVNADTIVFDIPSNTTDPEDFAVRNMDMFVNDSEYNIEVFDMDEDLTAKVVIVKNSSGRTNVESPIAVVDKITRVKNDNGEDVEKLYAYSNGVAVSYLSAQSGLLVKSGNVSLKQGDIIQLKTNVKNEIDTIDVLFDISTKGTQTMQSPAEGLDLIYGKVERKFTNSVNVSVNGANLNNYSLEGVKIYSYDSTKSTNNVTVASGADIAKYDASNPSYLFIRMYKDEVKEMVIIE